DSSSAVYPPLNRRSFQPQVESLEDRLAPAAVNHPPTAKADAYSIVHDHTLRVAAAAGVLTNDTDRNGELCTLIYPQKYGKSDPNARGMTGPTNGKDEITWGGHSKEVRYWGEWVLKRVKAEIGDLYPPIPDPPYKKKPE